MGKSVKNVYVVTNLLLYILIHDATLVRVVSFETWSTRKGACCLFNYKSKPLF